MSVSARKLSFSNWNRDLLECSQNSPLCEVIGGYTLKRDEKDPAEDKMCDGSAFCVLCTGGGVFMAHRAVSGRHCLFSLLGKAPAYVLL